MIQCAILQNLNGKSVFVKILLISLKICCQGKKSIASFRWLKTQNKDQNLTHIPLFLAENVVYTRETEYFNSVPVGTEFQNDHECEAQGIHSSLGPSA